MPPAREASARPGREPGLQRNEDDRAGAHAVCQGTSSDAHALELTAWDVPPTTAAGERLAFCVGARCSAGCDLGGRDLDLFDRHGARVGTAKLGHDVRAGTEALYFAAIEATAPLESGSHQWEAKMSGWEAELPHAGGSFPLIVRVVPAPDCEVTVQAVDREEQTPIAGARVVLHPYRAVTDENGMARLRVTRGQYDILVSATRYQPQCTGVDVTADMTTRSELDADRPWVSPDEDPE